jgi:hypothetical protein
VHLQAAKVAVTHFLSPSGGHNPFIGAGTFEGMDSLHSSIFLCASAPDQCSLFQEFHQCHCMSTHNGNIGYNRYSNTCSRSFERGAKLPTPGAEAPSYFSPHKKSPAPTGHFQMPALTLRPPNQVGGNAYLPQFPKAQEDGVGLPPIREVCRTLQFRYLSLTRNSF